MAVKHGDRRSTSGDGAPLLVGKCPITVSEAIIVTVIACSCLQSALAKSDMPVVGQSLRYCNPLAIEASSRDGSPRGVSLGDVTVVREGNRYYMFCTGGGAWVSQDLVNWKHRPVQGRVPVAPGVFKYQGHFYMSGNGAPLYRARDILGPYESVGDWKDHNGQSWTGTADNGLLRRYIGGLTGLGDRLLIICDAERLR